MIALIISLCSGAIVYAVSVMYAGIGETFSERAGIMNLGVEGVMLMGAVSGYITAVHTQNLFLSFLVVLLTGAALGLAFCIPYRNAAVRSDCMWYGNADIWNRIEWIYWKRCFRCGCQSEV